jgi:hypothetical protein
MGESLKLPTALTQNGVLAKMRFSLTQSKFQIYGLNSTSGLAKNDPDS